MTPSLLWRHVRRPRSWRRAAFLVASLSGRAGHRLVAWVEDIPRRILFGPAVSWGRHRTDARLRRGIICALWAGPAVMLPDLKVRADRMLGFSASARVFPPGASRMSVAVRRLRLAVALWRFDVFHLFYDRGLPGPPSGGFCLNPEELDLLRRAGKRVYAHAYGTDVRRPKSVLVPAGDAGAPSQFRHPDDAAAVAHMRLIHEWLTASLAVGDMLAYVPGARRLNCWAVRVEGVPPAPPPSMAGPARIAHVAAGAPEDPFAELMATIERLRAAGRAIEYARVPDPLDEAAAGVIGAADLVIGPFIGGEGGCALLIAMARAKPVLTRLVHSSLVEEPAQCPILDVPAGGLEDALRWCLEHRDRLPAIGAAGRIYVARWYSVAALAARLTRIYRETAEFPETIAGRLEAHTAAESARREAIPDRDDWYHPWCAAADGAGAADLVARVMAAPPVSPETVAALAPKSFAERWDAVVGEGQPRPGGWTSFDRVPWRHPWLSEVNLRDFAAFSARTFAALAARPPRPRNKTAFFGNIANIGQMRRAGLVRHSLNIDLFLGAYDLYPFSQPFWEEFDGDMSDLTGPSDPRIHAIAGMPGVFRPEPSSDWLRNGRGLSFPGTNFAAVFTEFMPYMSVVDALEPYDSLLISQFLQIAAMTSRPYVVAQAGGEVWFDAARGDALGWLSRHALRMARAVLVSNPITLAHARRYGLTNCLYLPLCLDETAYAPGAAPEIRSDWAARIGGDFFVLISMRLDNKWKGAPVALEGFARFARVAPGARLVVLGWGADEAAAYNRLNALGVADRALLLPPAGKVRLARYLQAADAFIEQFVLGYYGASGLEALASGLPVIMRLERAQYDAMIPAGAPPVLDAADATAVAAHLTRLRDDPGFRRDLGARGRAWFMASHAASHCAPTYRALLDAVADEVAIDWQASPLVGPPDEAECLHHARQAAHAPEFPKYEI